MGWFRWKLQWRPLPVQWLDLFPSLISITTVAVRGLVALFASGALIEAPTVLGPGRTALTRLRGSNPILISLGLPRGPSPPIVSACVLSVIAHDAAILVSVASAECGR